MGSNPAPTTRIGSSPRFGSARRCGGQALIRDSESRRLVSAYLLSHRLSAPPTFLSPSLPGPLSLLVLLAKMLAAKKQDTRRPANRSPGAFTIYQERLPGRQVQISIPPCWTMFLTDELPILSLYISLCPGPQTPGGPEANRGANLKVTDDRERQAHAREV